MRTKEGRNWDLKVRNDSSRSRDHFPIFRFAISLLVVELGAPRDIVYVVGTTRTMWWGLHSGCGGDDIAYVVGTT